MLTTSHQFRLSFNKTRTVAGRVFRAGFDVTGLAARTWPALDRVALALARSGAGVGQLDASTQAPAVLGRNASGEVEWFLDQGKQEGEIEPLCIGNVVNAYCHRSGDDRAEE